MKFMIKHPNRASACVAGLETRVTLSFLASILSQAVGLSDVLDGVSCHQPV